MTKKDFHSFFNRCVPRPGSKLTSSEQKCLAMCQDKYIQVTGVVQQAMMSRGGQ